MLLLYLHLKLQTSLNANIGGRAETSSAPNLKKTYVYPSLELSYLFTHHLKRCLNEW
jgi:hypothetical protein